MPDAEEEDDDDGDVWAHLIMFSCVKFCVVRYDYVYLLCTNSPCRLHNTKQQLFVL
jgi:hypothetical protein